MSLNCSCVQACRNADPKCAARRGCLGIYFMELSLRQCVIVDTKCYVIGDKLSV